MNAQIENASSPMVDVVKQVISVFMVIAAIAAFYFFSDITLLYRVLVLLLVVIAACGVVLTTQLGRNLWAFFVESKIEVKKVVWPTKDETIRTTLMVFSMVFVVGLVLWLLDMFLFWAVRFLTGQGA